MRRVALDPEVLESAVTKPPAALPCRRWHPAGGSPTMMVASAHRALVLHSAGRKSGTSSTNLESVAAETRSRQARAWGRALHPRGPPLVPLLALAAVTGHDVPRGRIMLHHSHLLRRRSPQRAKERISAGRR